MSNTFFQRGEKTLWGLHPLWSRAWCQCFCCHARQNSWN